MQEVFEKIIEKLEEENSRLKRLRNNCIALSDSEVSAIENKAYNFSIEIVKQEAEQYNNGWIPCSVSMPEERDSMFAKFKGTSKWNDNMFERTSEEVNVTVSSENGDKVTTHAHTTDGKWKCDLLGFNTGYHIIAWQPLPQPYQPKGDHDENIN